LGEGVGVDPPGFGSGVCVAMGVCVRAADSVFCACTVNATEVAISCSEEAVPQAALKIDRMINMVKRFSLDLMLIRKSFHEMA